MVREVPSFLVKVMLKNFPLVAAMRSSSWLFIVHYSSPSPAECNTCFDFKAFFSSKFAVDKGRKESCYVRVRIAKSLIFNDLRERGARIASALIFNELSIPDLSQQEAHPEGRAIVLGFLFG